MLLSVDRELDQSYHNTINPLVASLAKSSAEIGDKILASIESNQMQHEKVKHIFAWLDEVMCINGTLLCLYVFSLKNCKWRLLRLKLW